MAVEQIRKPRLSSPVASPNPERPLASSATPAVGEASTSPQSDWSSVEARLEHNWRRTSHINDARRAQEHHSVEKHHPMLAWRRASHAVRGEGEDEVVAEIVHMLPHGLESSSDDQADELGAAVRFEPCAPVPACPPAASCSSLLGSYVSPHLASRVRSSPPTGQPGASCRCSPPLLRHQLVAHVQQRVEYLAVTAVQRGTAVTAGRLLDARDPPLPTGDPRSAPSHAGRRPSHAPAPCWVAIAVGPPHGRDASFGSRV